jgi:WXG100 family type VII secretion target
VSEERTKVLHESMTGLVDRLTAGVAEIQRVLDTLEHEVSTLRGGWSGEASDAYERAQRAWTAQLHELHVYLAQHRDSAAHAQDVFATAKKRNEQIWS